MTLLKREIPSAPSPDGHVHIRFVDDAVLSVRPLSELEIIAYRFDQENRETH